MVMLSAAFLITFMGLAFHRTHLLSALLCLEGVMLSIFIGMGLWPLQLALSPLFLPLIMLTLSACEASLGLSFMIATARSYGTDNLKTLTLLQC